MNKVTIEELEALIAEFKSKHEIFARKSGDWLSGYIADVQKVTDGCPEPEGEVRERLAKFYNTIGCDIIVFGKVIDAGVVYYHKALELCPDSYDIHWGYYTTLEEIVEDEDYATDELIQDAIDCLTFCIEYCTTPELKAKHHVQNRYIDLARVYIAAKQPEKAVECAEEALKIEKYDYAYEILAKAKRMMKKENFFVRLWNKIRAFFNKK